jgi:hypothetical protein
VVTRYLTALVGPIDSEECGSRTFGRCRLLRTRVTLASFPGNRWMAGKAPAICNKWDTVLVSAMIRMTGASLGAHGIDLGLHFFGGERRQVQCIELGF